MPISQRASASLAGFILVLTVAHASVAHAPPAHRAQRERAVALALALQNSEPAPVKDAVADSCRLTIELVIPPAQQPVAGLVKVTNLGTGKEVAFSDEIHRDKNWYSL